MKRYTNNIAVQERSVITPRLFKVLSISFALLTTVWAGSANAELSAPVTVDEREWLQPVDFLGYSWNDVNAVCDANSGLCNGSLGGMT